LLDMRGHLVETGGVRIDEIPIYPAAADHDVKDAVEQRDIASRFHREKQVTGPRDRCHSRIDDDDARSIFTRLPDIACGDGRTFRHVRSCDQDHFRLRDVRPRVGGAINSKRLLVPGRGADHAQPAVVINVARPEGHPRELSHKIGFLRRQAGSGQHTDRVGAVCFLDTADLFAN
jgi:hypothetical protein